MAAARKYKELEARLGYHFRSRDLLKKALTHASVRQAPGKRRDNERLEFLGDRVLGLAIAELLWEIYPAAAEGELARLYNRLVRGRTCAAVARELDIGPFLVLSDAEAESGGREKETILADACEALIAALYIELGLEGARDKVLALWAAQIDAPHDERDANPKSRLQEWAAAAGRGAPAYRLVSRTGPDHAPVFTIEVEVAGAAPSRADGGSRQAAEKAAARAWLLREEGGA